jgi:hypothetical protein
MDLQGTYICFFCTASRVVAAFSTQDQTHFPFIVIYPHSFISARDIQRSFQNQIKVYVFLRQQLSARRIALCSSQQQPLQFSVHNTPFSSGMSFEADSILSHNMCSKMNG